MTTPHPASASATSSAVKPPAAQDGDMPRTNYASGEDGAKIIMFSSESKGVNNLLNDNDDDAYLITPCNPPKSASKPKASSSGSVNGAAKDGDTVAEPDLKDGGVDKGGDVKNGDGGTPNANVDAGADSGAASADTGAGGSSVAAPKSASAETSALGADAEQQEEVIISKYFVVELTEEIIIDTITIANYEYYSGGVKEFDVYGSSVRPAGSIVGGAGATVGTGANGGVIFERELLREGGKWAKLNGARSFVAENNLDEQAFTIGYSANAGADASSDDNADGGGDAAVVGGKTATINTLVWAKYLLFVWKSHHGNEHYCTLSKFHVHGLDAISAIRLEVEMADRELADAETIMSNGIGGSVASESITSTAEQQQQQQQLQFQQQQQQQQQQEDVDDIQAQGSDTDLSSGSARVEAKASSLSSTDGGSVGRNDQDGVDGSHGASAAHGEAKTATAPAGVAVSAGGSDDAARARDVDIPSTHGDGVHESGGSANSTHVEACGTALDGDEAVGTETEDATCAVDGGCGADVQLSDNDRIAETLLDDKSGASVDMSADGSNGASSAGAATGTDKDGGSAADAGDDAEASSSSSNSETSNDNHMQQPPQSSHLLDQVSVLDSLPRSLVPSSQYKKMDTEMYRLMLYKMKNLEYNQSVIEHFLESLHGSYSDHFNRLEKRIIRLEEECGSSSLLSALATADDGSYRNSTTSTTRVCSETDVKVYITNSTGVTVTTGDAFDAGDNGSDDSGGSHIIVDVASAPAPAVSAGNTTADTALAFEEELRSMQLQFLSLQCYTYLAVLMNVVLFVTIVSIIQGRAGQAPQMVHANGSSSVGGGHDHDGDDAKEERGGGMRTRRKPFWLSTSFLVGVVAIFNGTLGLAYHYSSKALLK